MRRLVLLIAALALCWLCVYADDDEISRQLEQEALQAINTHNFETRGRGSSKKQDRTREAGQSCAGQSGGGSETRTGDDSKNRC